MRRKRFQPYQINLQNVLIRKPKFLRKAVEKSEQDNSKDEEIETILREGDTFNLIQNPQNQL
jgi:hypothetical protein